MRTDEIIRNVGINVRRMRENMRLSQETFAEACGLHRTHIGKIERGDFDITLTTLASLATGLGVDPSKLIRKPPKGAKSKPLPRGPKPGVSRRARRARG